MECSIGFFPDPKSTKDGVHEFLQFREVSIMRTKTPGQLPNPFDRIDIGTVGRKKIDLQPKAMLVKPRQKNSCMVMPGVVCNHDHLSIRAGMTKKDSQKSLECLGVERLGRLGDQAPVGRADGPVHRHRLAGRRMIEDRIGVFRGNPHDAPGPVLLKMASIGEPQIKVISSGQSSEFFYMRLWPQDRPGRSGTGVFSVGIPTDGIAAGTDGRPPRSDSGFSGDGLRVCHPRGSGDSPRVEARVEDLGRRPGGRSPIKPKAFPASLLPGARRSHYPENDGSSIEPSAGSAPEGPRCHRSSSRNKREAHHGADGHSGILRTVGSHPGGRAS